MPRGRRGRRRRWPGIVLAVVVVALGSATAYAWQKGYLARSYLQAVRGCGHTEWTSPEPEPPSAPVVALESIPAPEDLTLPTSIAFHPTLPLGYVTDRDGDVHVLDLGAQRIGPAVLTVPVSVEFDQGLLGSAVDPDGDWLYLNLTDLDGTSRLVAHPISASGDVDEGGVELLHVEQDAVHHNGGAVEFGPDGMLYATFGDGGIIGDRWGNGQRWEVLLGGLLRIDPSPEDPDHPYSIPPDNPRASEERGAENVAKGLRNPFRVTFDRANGDLWLGDVGHNCYEEIDHVAAADVAGANFGWNHFEGVRTFLGGEPDRYVPPLVAYPHRDAWCAVMGGYVYRGSAIPALEGRFLFSDFCGGALVALDPATAELTHLGVHQPAALGFAEDTDGELYLLSGSGVVQRIVPVVP